MRKDLAIAVLVTFLMSAMMFSIFPTVSQTMRQYDPWADINDDGIIDMKDIVYVIRLFGTTGTPINKTALLYNVNQTFTELLERIDSLNTTINTRVPKKGYVSISPAEFTPGYNTQPYDKSLDGLWGQGRFDADIRLPHGATLTKMIVRVTDTLTDAFIDVYIRGNNITGNYGLGILAEVMTTGPGAPGSVILCDDTISNGVIDNKNCVYVISVYLSKKDIGLYLQGIILEYEYPS